MWRLLNPNKHHLLQRLSESHIQVFLLLGDNFLHQTYLQELFPLGQIFLAPFLSPFLFWQLWQGWICSPSNRGHLLPTGRGRRERGNKVRLEDEEESRFLCFRFFQRLECRLQKMESYYYLVMNLFISILYDILVSICFYTFYVYSQTLSTATWF